MSNKYVRDKMLLVLAAHALHFSGPAKFKVRPRPPRFPRQHFRGATPAHLVDDFRFCMPRLTPDGFAQFPEAYQATTGSRQEPKYDLHAPDLYIPTMAFTTYIILNAFALGTYGE